MSEDLTRYVKAACEGDVDALARLFSKTLKTSYYLASKLSEDDAAAVEITKKAYARAFCTVTKLKKPEAFEIWMKQNVINIFKDGRTFNFSEAEGGAEETSMEFLSESVIGNVAATNAVLDSAALLDTERKTAVLLHYFCGMPASSIARYFEVSESTVNALLESAKAEIFQNSGSEPPANVPVGTYPVLTRLFQDEMEAFPVDSADVREIYTYAKGIYDSFRKVENAKTGEQDPKTTYFTPKPASSQSVSSSYGSSDGLSIPRAPEKQPEDEIDYSAFTDEEPGTPRSVPAKKSGIAGVIDSVKKFDFRKLDIKKIAILAAVVLALILLIVGIAKAKNRNKTPEPVQTSDVVNEDGTVKTDWKAGGFEEVSEVTYLDSHALMIKSKSTGKYGLIDYQGNVILAPEFEYPFERCSYGRDYDGSDSYHTLCKKDQSSYYQVIYSADNSATISPIAHEPHDIGNTYLDKGTSYDERDRYFEGYAAARKNGKWGYVKQDNDKKVIPYEYDAVNNLTGTEDGKCDFCRPVCGGYIPVKKGDLMGIIDLKNNTVVNFEYQNIMPGLNGVFIAQKDGVWGVILIGNAVDTFLGVNLKFTEVTEDVSEFEGDESKTYVVLADLGINVRSGPGSGYEKIGEVASGEEVEGVGTATSEDTGKEWLKIKWKNGYGYIAKSYTALA